MNNKLHSFQCAKDLLKFSFKISCALLILFLLVASPVKNHPAYAASEPDASSDKIQAPGFYTLPSQPPASPRQAQMVLSGPAVEEEVLEIATRMSFPPQDTAEIAALAQGLKNNVDLIYEYVHDHIKYDPLFGYTKGPIATIADGRGNSFDQSALMIALLRAAGYDAGFVHGEIDLTNDQLENWLGGRPGYSYSANILNIAQIPNVGDWVFVGDDFVYTISIDHVWVKVAIAGTNYFFDPSFKTHLYKSPIDLAAAMAYDRSSFNTAALSGSSSGDNYIKKINDANIRTSLAGYTSNLVNYIKANYPGAVLSDVIGGKSIELVRGTSLRQTSLPNQHSILAEWVEIPDGFKHSLRLQYEGIDETLFSADIYGKRLTIFFDDTDHPVLRLDGVAIATGNQTVPGVRSEVVFSVDHPYVDEYGNTDYGDQTVSADVVAGNSIFIVNGWGGSSPGMVTRHRKIMAENIHDGGSNTAEPVLGEAMAMVAYSWLAENSMLHDLSYHITESIAQQTGNVHKKISTIRHHVLGLLEQGKSLQLDIPSDMATYDGYPWLPVFYNLGGHGSGLEWGVIDQLQPYSAVSTVKLLGMSNGRSDKIFDVSSLTDFATIAPQLVNYKASTLSNIETAITNGDRVIFPEDGTLEEGDWQGIGYLQIGSDNLGFKINGGIYGGHGILEALLEEIYAKYEPEYSLHCQTTKPIDLFSGSHLYSNKDLSIGSSNQIGLDFKRFYSSGARLNNSPLGSGWSHNFNASIVSGSNGFVGLGQASAIDAAAAIVELYVTTDILTDNDADKSTEQLLIASIAQRWLMEQLIDNVVTVSEADRVSRFIKQPDGSYLPSPGYTGTLIQEGDGSYLLTTKQGVEVDFNLEGRLASWKDPNDNITTLTYADNKLQSVSNSFNRTLTFSYDGAYISGIIDDSGRSVAYAYDGSGNLTAFVDVTGETTTFDYNPDNRLTSIFYPANPATPHVTKTYDALGRVVTQIDGVGNTSNYYLSGFRTELVNAAGDSTILYFNDRGRKIFSACACSPGLGTSFEYDGYNRLVRKTFPEGNREEYEYDENNNRTKVILEAKPGSGESPIIKTYTYDSSFNKLKTYVDPLGALTTFNYDTKGNLIGMTQPAVTGGSPYNDFTYNSSGLLITIIDAMGMTTGFTYDPNSGDLLSTTVSQTSLNLTTQVTYDPVGNQITITDPLGYTTGYQYDPGRLITQITAPAPLSYVTKYSYDANGRLVKTEQETGDSENPWQTAILSYTATGKLESYMNTMGNSSTAQYDPADRLWKTTDAENHTREYLYNSFGQIQRLIGALGETEREYIYNDNGLTQSLTDASGNTTTYGYDGFDRLDETTYADGSSESFSYDSTGNLTQKRNRANEFINYDYDDLHRLVSKSLPGPTTTSYIYDLAGLLIDVIDPGGNIHYSYDSAGRLTAATYPGGKTVGYGYDNGSNRNRLTYPDGYYITYDYDALNRLTEINESGDTSLAQYEYDPLSRRTVMNCGNGTSATYAWDEDNKLINLENQFNFEAVNFSYSYDKIGNKLSTTVDDDRFSFKPQNIIDSDYVSNNLNQYASVKTTSFTYDSNGNLTFDGNNHYTYNPDNRLVGANTPTASVVYLYNPLGWRTSKGVDGQTTSYIHDNDQVIMEYDNSGQLRRRYIYGPKIDQPVCMEDNGDVYYYHFDGGGSVVALTDNLGNVIETYTYNAYGMTDDLSALGNPYLYTGREYDSESGLYYYRARYYNPVYGRFLQVDPIGYKDGMNMYAYTKNNPINWSDPHGLTSLAEQFYIEVMVDLGRIFQLTQSQTDQLKSSANSVAQIAAGAAGIGLFIISAPASIPMALAGLAGAVISFIGVGDGLLNLLSWDWYNEALHPDTGMFEEAGKNIGVVCEMKETGQSVGKVADVASIFLGVSVTRSLPDAGLAIIPIIQETPSLLK